MLLVWQGGQAGGEYYAGFLIEKSLSIDNVFVWAVIFSFFAVPREYQFRVLFWGIFGALVLRGIFIFAGVSLIERFEWILYVFGAFLLYTAWKIAHHDESEQVDYNANIAMRLVRRVVPTTDRYDGQKLFTRENGKRLATPLFAVLVLIEATDVVFAVDSVPAILAVSREPFIVFAANAFAILGLRSLYFLLGGMQGKFRYLNVGLGVILAFVGVKMLLIGEPFEVHLPTYVSLGVIAVVIAGAVVASLGADARDRRAGLLPTRLPEGDADSAGEPGAVDPWRDPSGHRDVTKEATMSLKLDVSRFRASGWRTPAHPRGFQAIRSVVNPDNAGAPGLDLLVRPAIRHVNRSVVGDAEHANVRHMRLPR